MVDRGSSNNALLTRVGGENKAKERELVPDSERIQIVSIVSKQLHGRSQRPADLISEV